MERGHLINLEMNRNMNVQIQREWEREGEDSQVTEQFTPFTHRII